MALLKVVRLQMLTKKYLIKSVHKRRSSPGTHINKKSTYGRIEKHPPEILALGGVILSLYAIIQEEILHNDQHIQLYNPQQIQHVFNIALEKKVIDVLIVLFLIFSALAVVFSVFLIVGIKKNNKDYVVAYLGYGIFLVILLLISAILEFLQRCFPAGIICSIFGVFYICCIIPVYQVYEMMANGLEFGNNPYAVMENEE